MEEINVGTPLIRNGKDFMFLYLLGSIIEKSISVIFMCHSTLLGCKYPATLMWHCFLLTETADNTVSETTELPSLHKMKKRKKDKKKKKKREREELYLPEGNYTYIYTQHIKEQFECSCV